MFHHLSFRCVYILHFSTQVARRCLKLVCASLEKVILSVNLDGAVRGGVGDASEDEALLHLIVVEEVLLGLVHRALLEDTGAGGAGTGAAGVRQVNAGLLRGVDDENIVSALNGLINTLLLGDELDGVAKGGGLPSDGGDRSEGGGRADESKEDRELEHGWSRLEADVVCEMATTEKVFDKGSRNDSIYLSVDLT